MFAVLAAVVSARRLAVAVQTAVSQKVVEAGPDC